MSRFFAAAVIMALGLSTPVFGQGSVVQEGIQKPYEISFTAKDKVDIAEAVEAYVYGRPPDTKSIKLFDDVKGKIMVLTYQRLNLTDKDCTVELENGFYIVCGEFSSPDGDQYEVGFALRRKTEGQAVRNYGNLEEGKSLQAMTVRDVNIRSVNGVQRIEWKKGEDGIWRPKPMDDGAPAS